MLLKEEKREACEKCGRFIRIIQEASYGCDNCKKPIDDLINTGNTRYRDYLEITVFHHEGAPTERFQFCSWKCVFNFLKKTKTDYFLSLPFLSFEKTAKGQRVKDFLACIKWRE